MAKEMDMQQLPNLIQSIEQQRNSVQTSRAAEEEQSWDNAISQATSLLRMFPDFDKTTKEMLGAIAAKLESLPQDTVRKICNPVSGIASKQPYAPTVYHIEEFVKNTTLEISQTTYKYLAPGPLPEGYDHDTDSRKAFIESLRLEEKFPDATHRKPKLDRVKWDGPATESALKPEGSKFETPKEFPAHLLNTTLMKEIG